MNPVDEYAQQVGHLFVEWRRAESKLRQLDGQFRATAAELQKAQTELETRPKEEPVATSRLCAWCDTAVVVPGDSTAVAAMGRHVQACAGSPLIAAMARIEELEALVEKRRAEFEVLHQSSAAEIRGHVETEASLREELVAMAWSEAPHLPQPVTEASAP